MLTCSKRPEERHARFITLPPRQIRTAPEDRYPGWADLALEIAGTDRFSKSQQDLSGSDKFRILRNNDTLHEDEPGQDLYFSWPPGR